MPGAPALSGRAALPPELDRILHDLRGPLNAAAMHLQVLKRVVQDDRLAEQSLATLEQQIGRLGMMLTAALAIAALEPRARERVDTRALLANVVREPGLESVALASGPWPAVVGDPDLLRLAVRHLLRNAVEATAGRAAARTPVVQARRRENGEGASVDIVVRDWGAGFPGANPRAALRLGASTKDAHEGVGLVTVERIARVHAGRLTLSARDDGADATLTLPAG